MLEPHKLQIKGELLSVPAALGYRMPAEWERHDATWLSWPHDIETWPEQSMAVESTYLRVIECLHRTEKVHLLVCDRPSTERVLKKLDRKGISENVLVHTIETNSNWIRDYGPTFLVRGRGELAFAKWNFNAWGRKYDQYEADNRASEGIKKLTHAREFRAGMVMEGGAIDVNGTGTVMTTEQCLLHPNRNAGLSRKAIEQRLKDYLGASRVIWLEGGIAGDDTDGHIDNVARFVASNVILAAQVGDSINQDFSRIKKNWIQLSESASERGERFELVAMPMPEEPVNGSSVPASYLNFYIGNQCVLAPTYEQKSDQTAIEILKDLFPSREVIEIPCLELILGLGAIHCMTQQQPATIG